MTRADRLDHLVARAVDARRAWQGLHAGLARDQWAAFARRWAEATAWRFETVTDVRVRYLAHELERSALMDMLAGAGPAGDGLRAEIAAWLFRAWLTAPERRLCVSLDRLSRRLLGRGVLDTPARLCAGATVEPSA